MAVPMKKVFPGILMTISLFAQAVRADEGQDVRWHVTSRAQAPVVGQNPVRSFVATGTVRKVDRDNCEPDLLEALTLPSHNEIICRAAVDG